MFLTFLFVNVGNTSAQQKHEYVDLGLPSGTLWATCNVGADNPWDYGDYFAWGETTTKSTYSCSNYKYGNGSDKDVSKKYNGNDHKTTLDPSDDAATANWGSDWCMPTQAQFQELTDKCTWTSTSRNGKSGYNVKGPNGKSIFLPAAGSKGSDGTTSNLGSDGEYWSSSLHALYPYVAREFGFVLDCVGANSSLRYYGNSVRPVRCNATSQSQSQLTVNNATSQSQSQSKGKHEYVDLGLPSGTLWATCNVGAANPWDYGDYFAWGETTTKSTYEWSNYKHGNGSDYDVSKKYNGNDHKATLDPSDDAATANWGSDWCIPTQAQFQELYDNCTNEWTTDYKGKGVAGRVFMSKKNGNTIFFPAAGSKVVLESPLYLGSYGYYSSSSIGTDYPYFARYLDFHSSDINPDNWSLRYCGQSVRPVRCRN